MQNYFADWTTKLISSFFTGNTSLIFNLLDKEEKFTFEKQYKNVISRSDFEKIVYQVVRSQIREEGLSKTWSEFIINHFLFKINKYRENFQISFNSLKECFNSLAEIYENLESPSFMTPILKFYMRNLLFSSHIADEEMIRKKQNPVCIDECGRVLITFFSQFSKGEDKPLVFFSVICLIRIYFKLKTYRSSKTLVSWVEKSGLDFDYLPKAEVTTFFYYSGKLNLYELRLIEARDILNNAFTLCKSNHIYNKKLILEHLIPLNLFFGVTPSKEMIEKYELISYFNLVNAYQNGDMVKFEDSILNLEERLITLGTFLIVEKLKPFVMRNLVKIIYKTYSEELSRLNQPVIKVELIYEIVKNVIGLTSMDLEELELYLIGVIYKGLISGYIHNNNKVIVFSKKNPFPKLQDVIRTNYSKII